MHSGPDGSQTSMYDKVLMLRPGKEEFFMNDLPLYIPPPIFSRLDMPADYYYRPETQHREGYHNPTLSSENLIGLSRARRPHNAIFVNFEDEEIPTKPLAAAQQTWKRVCSNAVDHKAEDKLRKDSVYIFREGSLPPYRQMFYQLCDLNVECLQKIIHRNDGMEVDCTERDGWCLPKTSDDLRDTMSLMIKQDHPLQKTRTSNADEGKEQLAFESGEEEEEEEEFKPSDGSENEMETEILDYAKSYKNRCMQPTLTQTDIRGSEDCLYLNIWVPQGKKEVSTNLPVMIWIYGGAFLWGGGQSANFLNNYLYDGEEIADRGKVIVVTFNYRLGPLGFLSTGDANLPGNYGLKDQHMAIAWVKRNIKSFGGDPNNITIFGESAGAVSVSLQVAQIVVCPTYNTTALANCLRVTDPEALTRAYHLEVLNLPCKPDPEQSGVEGAGILKGQGIDTDPLVHYLVFSLVIDGDFIPDRPENLFANTADIDYITGVNNMDGHFFASIDMPALNRLLVKITAVEVYHIMRGLTMVKGVRGANATFDLYTRVWSDNVEQEVMKRTVIDVETDFIFLVPTQQTLDLHYQNASWVGADHADDIQYVFGKPFATPLGYKPRHRTVSKAMIAYWTNFARTGDISYDSVKQGLRLPYVQFWEVAYRSLPDV
ncbi:hypothetical protein lerEdw1_020791 [Lerista edwardsae]|nr:hypothetical protein lerEdw1_020791 [Lerista edwardsae]